MFLERIRLNAYDSRMGLLQISAQMSQVALVKQCKTCVQVVAQKKSFETASYVKLQTKMIENLLKTQTSPTLILSNVLGPPNDQALQMLSKA
jgi:hypothetical protein